MQIAMVLTSSRFLWLLQAAFLPLVYSTSITDIQGPAFRSPFEGQTVTGVTGIVIAKVCILSAINICALVS